MPGNQTASQTIVVVAMGLVAAAGAAALNQHGMPGPVAATAALAAYLLLLTAHAFLWRRANRGASASAEAPRDRRADMTRRTQDAGRKAPAAPAMPAQGRAGQPAPSSEIATKPIAPTGTMAAPMPIPPPMPLHAPGAPMQAAARSAPDRAMPPPLPAGPSPSASNAADDFQDVWSFRPTPPGQKLPPFVTGRASEPTLPGAAAGEPASTLPPQQRASSPREADVEVIQDAIKRLLEEVNAAEQNRAQATSSPADQLGPPVPSLSLDPAAMPPPMPHAPRQSPEASIDMSIEALRMTAGSMRAAMEPPPYSMPTPSPVAASAPPPLPPFVRGAAPMRPQAQADARARLMADAISAGRIDVTLEPILGLEDQQTRHYEVSVRLRDADGNPLDVTPEGPDLRGTGLLPLFDGVRVARTAAVARRLEDRGKGGSVFSAFSGESVADEHFLGELAETLHLRASLAAQLVLSFTQTDVRGFSTPEWDSLADMRALGFRFAISHLTDLDMDFEALAEQGFVFAKLDASVFLEGLRAPSSHLLSSEVCRHLARHGLTLVVEHIENDDQLARVFGFGVLLGQGQLFGGARPVRADVANDRRRGNATAAA